MSATATLLVELLTEELPPKALQSLGEEFGNLIWNGLIKAGLAGRTGRTVHATPRRLAVQIPDVALNGQDRETSVRLMPAKVAFDGDGQATLALKKRLDKEGASENEIERRTDDGVESIHLTRTIPGIQLVRGLQLALDDAIARLPIPKVMTYQRPDGSDQKFVRPAHRLVVLHGADVIPVTALGLHSGRITEGHRFQGEREISLAHADEYESRLAGEGKVTSSFDTRRNAIEAQLQDAAAKLDADLQPDAVYAALLDEVTALTENPAVYVGRFEQEFLDVPQECLILTMRTNQKYFPLFDRAGKLRQEFLIVSNLQLADPSRVITGNERVIRPRLADAKFFYDQDRKTRLVDRLGRLANVVYHNKLGSQMQRIERLQLLSAQIAKLIGADPALAQHAAALAKADLVTDMVGEFPELQGIMGRYYALHDGEPMEVADAIAQHYRPKFAGDKLPEGKVAICIALADKIDTLAGIYGIGLLPTGDKDAYGLRRHALGVLRILIERNLPLELPAVLQMAASHFFHDQLSKSTVADLHGFILERLRGLLRDGGYTANEVEAVLSQMPARIDQVPARLAAVREFGALPEAEALAAANKRIQNILKKAGAPSPLPSPEGRGSKSPSPLPSPEGRGSKSPSPLPSPEGRGSKSPSPLPSPEGRGSKSPSPLPSPEGRGSKSVGTDVDPSLFAEDAERALHRALSDAEPAVGRELDAGRYTEALRALAGLRGAVDTFFDKVLVNAEDLRVRANRLALLNRLGLLMNRVADISKLAG